MNRLVPLPRIMVAPNGARRDKADHPALPLTIAETVEAARLSFEAGANALHAHVRDGDGAHSLDPGAYRELIAEMAAQVPDMPVQITTEAAGMFGVEAQRRAVLDVNPEGASVAIREMWHETASDQAARAFYRECAERGVAIQHIAYSPDDLTRILSLAARGDLPGPIQTIFVLGAYASQTPGQPSDLDRFLACLDQSELPVDLAVCAFGPRETECLAYAARKGGQMRVGFENNLINAERVAELVRALNQ
ncbi:MAG: 3-keto-5-aminohexanoate cleavage protein [Pseudomonadota bacterium]